MHALYIHAHGAGMHADIMVKADAGQMWILEPPASLWYSRSAFATSCRWTLSQLPSTMTTMTAQQYQQLSSDIEYTNEYTSVTLLSDRPGINAIP